MYADEPLHLGHPNLDKESRFLNVRNTLFIVPPSTKIEDTQLICVRNHPNEAIHEAILVSTTRRKPAKTPSIQSSPSFVETECIPAWVESTLL